MTAAKWCSKASSVSTQKGLRVEFLNIYYDSKVFKEF